MTSGFLLSPKLTCPKDISSFALKPQNQAKENGLPEVLLNDAGLILPGHPDELAHALATLVRPALSLDVGKLVDDVGHQHLGVVTYEDSDDKILT